MPRKLSDDDVAELRRIAATGRNHTEIAAEFDITDRHVRRLVQESQRTLLGTPQDGPVLAAVRRLLAGLELDDSDEVLAAGAEVLAAKLDVLRVSDSAASSAAAPALLRELALTLRGLRGEADDVAETVRQMLEPLRRPT